MTPAVVRNKHIARGIQRHAQRKDQQRLGGRSAVPLLAQRSTGAGESGHNARRRVHSAHAGIPGIGNVQIPFGVHRYVRRIIQLGLGCLTAVAAVTRNSSSCHRRDRAGCPVDLAYPVLVAVGNVEVPGRVRDHSNGEIQFRINCRIAVSAKARDPGACIGVDVAGGEGSGLRNCHGGREQQIQHENLDYALQPNSRLVKC